MLPGSRDTTWNGEEVHKPVQFGNDRYDAAGTCCRVGPERKGVSFTALAGPAVICVVIRSGWSAGLESRLEGGKLAQ